jgi:hypothetical protein
VSSTKLLDRKLNLDSKNLNTYDILVSWYSKFWSIWLWKFWPYKDSKFFVLWKQQLVEQLVQNIIYIANQTGVDGSDESSPGRLWIQVAPKVSYNEPFLQAHGLAMICPDFERII